MNRPRAFLIADLAYGDSGKGTVVDWLTQAHDADLVVRYNGGPQAGHNVVQPDGRHHTFSQFGSGLFHTGTRTLLAERMLIDPYAMLNEAEHLQAVGIADPLGRTLIDSRCRVITPPQQVANRIRERARGHTPHGTCGMGVGECVADNLARPDLTLHASDLINLSMVARKLRDAAEFKRREIAPLLVNALPDELRIFKDFAWIDVAVELFKSVASRVTFLQPDAVHALVRSAKCLIFEGAQGVLLDEDFGFHPHTTWSDTTFTHADTLLSDAGFAGAIERIGVTRTYATRHGAGPMVSACDDLTRRLAEPHNVDTGWQGRFRCGPIDLVALRYALAALGGEISLAVTHLDCLPDLPGIACEAYSIYGVAHAVLPARVDAKFLERATPIYCPWPTRDADAFVAALESHTGLSVTLRSNGPTFLDKLRHGAR